MFRIFKK